VEVFMSETAYCITCQAVAPVVRQTAGKAIGAALASAIGGAATKSVGGTIVLGLVGLVVGHLVDEALEAVCGQCGSQVQAEPAKV
jgi:hypothetical protein